MEVDNCVPVQEFEQWYAMNSKGDLQLYISNVIFKEDGGTCLELGFGTDEKAFQIVCSKGYPDTSNIIVNACIEVYSQGVAQINKYISDLSGSVKLPAIFGKSLEIFTSLSQTKEQKASSSNISDSDFEDDSNSSNGKQTDQEMPSDSDAMDDENFTTEFDFKMDLLRKRWMVKEKETRLKLKAEKDKVKEQLKTKKTSSGPSLKYVKGIITLNVGADASSSDEDNGNALPKDDHIKAGRQIFSHKDATFQILSNEMISLIFDGKNEGLDCFTIDDSLYKWQVKLSSFQSNSPLDDELKQLKRLYGFDYIEIELDFVPDYPFYPPLLRIVRPRFQGSLVQSLANIDLLKLTYWNPARTVRDVLRLIKDILFKHAKIDLTNESNNIIKNSAGSYLPLEDYLIKLALATEVRPRANFEIIDVENLPKAPVVKHAQTAPEKQTKTYWAKGSGYGSGRASKFGWSPETYLKAQLEKDRQIQSILSNVLSEIKKSIDKIKGRELFAILEGSALVPFFEDLLKTFTESSIEVIHKFELFQIVLQICDVLSDHDTFYPLLGVLPRQKHSLAYWLDKINTINQEGQKLTQKVEPSLKRKHAISPGTSTCFEDDTEKIEADTSRLLAVLCKKLDEKALTINLEADSMPCCSNSVTPKPQNDFETIYVTTMKPHQFKSFSFSGLRDPWKHHYYSNQKSEYKNEIRVIWKERISLESSLPLTSSSSIFLRYDDDNVHLLRALITGPEDTPYANGCFLFDLFYPQSYPNVPPYVNLQTTGGNRVRFNPNLYSSGKVCLSLLGTWSGDKGENWNPKTSTTLQIFISIQSLIFHDKPYFNEPGFETTIGTDKGEHASKQYNNEVRKNCLNIAIIDQLKNPPPGFEEIVKLHYKLKKDKVTEQINKWLEMDKNLAESVNKMKKMLTELN